MSKKIDYSHYKCPYSHLEKECGHELHSPDGYQDVYSVWCNCGYHSPLFYLDPDVLGLELKKEFKCMMCRKEKENDGHNVCEDCGGLAF